MKTLFFLLLAINLNTFSQIKSGTIEYGLTFSDDAQLDSGQLGDYLKDAKKMLIS
ncbi:MAG: hypothetical protein O9282_00750 [Flavobacterium sp.]|uniref:hypothetical protein n=1 Tax=Flavobacterium sp. TaxID=239 RepID=UPI0022C28DFA|nr:hypothetical protein [Flavobacterium sp.]MCZ8329818.1 hypothetical protein [Flavobacterium sp.]